MNTMIAAARRFAEDEDGITAIEYGLIAAVMAAAIVAAVGGVGTALRTAFQSIATTITTPPST